MAVVNAPNVFPAVALDLLDRLMALWQNLRVNLVQVLLSAGTYVITNLQAREWPGAGAGSCMCLLRRIPARWHLTAKRPSRDRYTVT